MTRIERSIEIDGRPDAVFATLADLDRLTEWATIVVETTDVSERPIRGGTTFRQKIRVAGQQLPTEWRVLACEPPRLVRYEATAALGGRMRMEQRVVAVGEGCRVTFEIDYELPGGILGDVADRAFLEERHRREADESLRNLKRRVEAPGSA